MLRALRASLYQGSQTSLSFILFCFLSGVGVVKNVLVVCFDLIDFLLNKQGRNQRFLSWQDNKPMTRLRC